MIRKKKPKKIRFDNRVPLWDYVNVYGNRDLVGKKVYLNEDINFSNVVENNPFNTLGYITHCLRNTHNYPLNVRWVNGEWNCYNYTDLNIILK